jgi:hypothetical protein
MLPEATSNASTHTNYLIQLLKNVRMMRTSLILTASRQSGFWIADPGMPGFRLKIGMPHFRADPQLYTQTGADSQPSGRFGRL